MDHARRSCLVDKTVKDKSNNFRQVRVPGMEDEYAYTSYVQYEANSTVDSNEAEVDATKVTIPA